jgi:hypothetical protein
MKKQLRRQCTTAIPVSQDRLELPIEPNRAHNFSQSIEPHHITRIQAEELLEFLESMGYDQDTPFELFSNEKVMPGNPSITTK